VKRLLFAVAIAVTIVGGCGDTGQPHVHSQAVAIGTPAHPVTVGAWTVTLDVVRVGFGPTIFCASRAASEDLCPQSLAEIASVAQIDALSPNAQPLGSLEGFVGHTRSVGFDYALPWFATDDAPHATSAAPGGHSIHLEGHATSAARSLRFVADVDVVAATPGARGVYFNALDAAVDESTQRLEVHFDPHRWVEQIDFDALPVADPVVLAGNAANAVIVGATTLAPPTFTFTR
jgi:hypothetical protein